MANDKLQRQTCSIHVWEARDGSVQAFVNFDPPIECPDDPNRVPNDVELLVNEMLGAARAARPELVI